ncbi:MAG: NhaA family Na+:H+ antiporter [Alphaproteobacteria bacterium]|jgi:NhaA family Na+:H+ antiporter
MTESAPLSEEKKQSRTLARLLKDFLDTEASGGIIMMFVALLAIVTANLNGFDAIYHDFIYTPISINFGDIALNLPLKKFVKDVFMVAFFLLVGLELKREMLEGFLSQKGQKLLPAIAALGGIVLPALIYYVMNMHEPAYLKGWAIPTATDIAFAVGVLAIVGRSMPPSAKIFLLAIAIYDDLAAIVIVALFYGNGFNVEYVPVVLFLIGTLFMINRLKISYLTPYFFLCGFLGIFLYKTGLHSTIAGVITALFIPIRLEEGSSKSPLGTAMHYLHPWVSYFILPLFAFVSAGIVLKGLSIENFFDTVPLGIILALFLGKQLGIMGLTFLAVKLKIADKPQGAGWLQLYAISALAGIGFTMSLFIGLLAFSDPILQAELKIGVIVGSLLSTILAVILIQISKKYAVAPEATQEATQ